jgi:hypothetical protein
MFTFSIAFANHLDLLENASESFRKKEIRQEITYIIENLDKNCIGHRLHFARLAFEDEDYDGALKKATEFQEYCTKSGGTACILERAYNLKLLCYVHFGNKKMAFECLKQMKRYNKKSEEIPLLEELVKLIPSDEDSTKIPARTVEKCAFNKCKKVESYPKEFSFCTRCQVVRYCSVKCQSAHWKSEHKFMCQGGKEETNETQTTTKIIALKKCSYYDCKNVETFINKQLKLFSVCASCEKVSYCSKKCQKKDWKHGHRDVCKPRNSKKSVAKSKYEKSDLD